MVSPTCARAGPVLSIWTPEEGVLPVAQPITSPVAVASGVTSRGKFASLVNGPQVLGALAVIATEPAPPPPAIGPAIVQLTTVVPVHPAGLEDTKVNPAGSVSVTSTLEAGALPLFVTVTVQLMFPLAATVAGPVLAIDSAAAQPIT